MTQQFRALAALAGYTDSVSSTHTEQITTVYKSSFRDLASKGISGKGVHRHTHGQNTNVHNMIKFKLNKFQVL